MTETTTTRGVVLVEVAGRVDGREQRVGDGIGSLRGMRVHHAQDVRVAQGVDAVAGHDHHVAGLQRQGHDASGR